MSGSTVSTRRASDQFLLRLPDGMREEIAKAASSSGRSRSGEIVSRLRRSFGGLDDALRAEIALFGCKLSALMNDGAQRIAELERQRDDLQAANNRYLQRARDAEAALAAIMSAAPFVALDPDAAHCCRKCEEARRDGAPLSDWGTQRRYFILCSICGNKRCPRATDHSLTCTGSNEPGQPGSDYA